MEEDQIQEIKQLIVRDQGGNIIDVGLMNVKCYTKSIERNRLWVLHRDTGRVLPLEPEHSLVGLKQFKRWYEAVVFPLETSDPEVPRATPEHSDISHKSDSLNREFPGPPGGSLLDELEEVVRDRYTTMPEGSYTTHLFASGSEKIRKKTGEEAIELILASSPDEMIYEAADLLYHLCVLLVSEGLSFQQVFALLRERHTAG